MKGLSRDRKKMLTRPITCSKCGTSGGTMVKDGDDQYQHQDKGKCRIMQHRIKIGGN